MRCKGWKDCQMMKLEPRLQVLEATDSMDNKMEQVVDGAQRVFRLVYR
jgi:hypothetical protein